MLVPFGTKWKNVCSCIGRFVLLSWLQAVTCLQRPFFSWMNNLAPRRKEQRGFSKFLRPKEVATDFLSSKCPETPRGLDVDFFTTMAVAVKVSKASHWFCFFFFRCVIF